MDFLDFLGFWDFLNFFGFFLIFFRFFWFFGISFKVTKVTTKCYQGYYWTPKILPPCPGARMPSLPQPNCRICTCTSSRRPHLPFHPYTLSLKPTLCLKLAPQPHCYLHPYLSWPAVQLATQTCSHTCTWPRWEGCAGMATPAVAPVPGGWAGGAPLAGISRSCFLSCSCS